MRLAVLLMTFVPAYALAQSVPPQTKPLPPATASAPPSGQKPTPPKPGAAPASKPGAKPTDKPATKPAPKPVTAGKKPPPGKQAPRKPSPPVPHPVPVPDPSPVEPPAAEAKKGSNTGLALPRFAALRSDDVNFRSGPGTRFPIEWVYKRRDLPVQIEREFEIWRLVRDPEGNKGWVHQATLTGRRTAVVAGSEHVLRQAADDTAGPVATLKPGVIIRLRTCEANSIWCQAQIGDYRGFIKRSDIWGVLPDEVIQ